jgi:hypothetical protein
MNLLLRRLRPHSFASLALLAAGLAGCRSPLADVRQREPVVAGEFREEVRRLETLPGEELGWARARALLLERNLELRQARNAAISAEERLRQVWRDLRPGAALTANLVKGLTQLGNLDSSDASLSLYAFFNVPGVVQFRVRHYAAGLELVRARWAAELKERELTIRLRDLFLRAELLRQRRQNLALAALWQEAGPAGRASFDAEPKALQRETALWGITREEDAQQAAFAQLLGDSGRRWRPAAAGLPALPYQADAPNVADTEKFGLLYRQLQAVELEGARLREFGVRLQHWPDLTITLTSPPLAGVQGGREQRWDFDQVVTALTASVNLDLRGAIAQQLEETRRDVALLTDALRAKNTETIQNLLVAREALQRNALRLRLTEQRLNALRGLPRSLEPAVARVNLERLLTLDEQRTGLLLERAQLEALFWLLDEARWPRPAWPEPAAAS